MAYYTKEAYERKREHAYNVSGDSIRRLSSATGISEDKLSVIAEASHLRHEIHSENRWHFVSGSDRWSIDRVGTKYSFEQTLAEEIDGLCLLDESFPTINEPDVCDDDSPEDIMDYFGLPVPGEDEDENRDAALDALVRGWDDAINSWSAAVRGWFGNLNNRYGTNFPC